MERESTSARILRLRFAGRGDVSTRIVTQEPKEVLRRYNHLLCRYQELSDPIFDCLCPVGTRTQARLVSYTLTEPVCERDLKWQMQRVPGWYIALCLIRSQSLLNGALHPRQSGILQANGHPSIIRDIGRSGAKLLISVAWNSGFSKWNYEIIPWHRFYVHTAGTTIIRLSEG